MLLGGHNSAGKSTPFLGIGGYVTATYKQDTNCTTKSANYGGFYSGPSFPPAKWGIPGGVYIR